MFTSTSISCPLVHSLVTTLLRASVAGRLGTDVSGDAAWRVAVRSPVTLRRHAEMFGAGTPKRVSRKRICDVWSKVSEQT